MKVKNYKTKLVLLVLLLITIGVGLAVFTAPKNKPQSPIIPITQVNQINPGSTTLDQLNQLPDQFSTQKNASQITILTGQNKSHSYSSINIKDNIVSHIIISDISQFEFIQLLPYLNKYGQPDQKFYGPWQASGYFSYLYLKYGLIVIAHQSTNKVVEIWKIPQNLTFPQFLNQYPQFSSSPQSPNRL